MESLSRNGLNYRTKCLTIDRAASFARALQANPRFDPASVSIETSTRAKSAARYFVQFLPSSADRRHDMRERQQDARAVRAVTQGFTFCLDKDGGRPFFWCWSHTSGEVYEVAENAESCNCPDHEFRCRHHGLSCKHQLALQNADPAELRTW